MNWLVDNTLAAAVLALLVLAVGRSLRPAPAVMHVLWLFVLLKLVTPPLFAVPVAWPWAAPPEVVTVDLGTLHPDRWPAVLPAPEVRPATAAPAVSAPSPWPFVLFAGWAVGTVLFLGGLGLGIVRGGRRLRTLGPVPPWLRAEVAELAARLAVRVPELRNDPIASSPCVWSLGRVRLLLPVAVLAAASPKGRAAVLAHELAHLRRGDHFVAYAELLLASLLWWHPLFWFARARLRLWAELACDAWAVASVPEATIDYATVLVDAVARPDSAVPGMTVLASRPAARAAFERRLTMILNETVPCRASRAWWLPFTTLGLGLFAVPVAAQNEEPPPVRVEIKVNGRDLRELEGEERRALLQRLLREEEEAAAEAAPAKTKKAKLRSGKAKPKAKAEAEVVDPTQGPGQHELHELLELHELHGQIAGAHAELHKALAEAKAEIRADEDLRELGIDDEVARLIDDLAEGKGMQGSLDAVIKAAMKGASKVVAKELENDPDLRELGLTEGIGTFVTGLLENEHNQEMLGELFQRATAGALQKAKVEIRNDADLRELGIAVDVEALVDSLLSGKGDFDASLHKVVHKAMQGAMRHLHDRDAEAAPAEDPAEAKPAKPAKSKAKKAKQPKPPAPQDRESLIR